MCNMWKLDIILRDPFMKTVKWIVYVYKKVDKLNFLVWWQKLKDKRLLSQIF